MVETYVGIDVVDRGLNISQFKYIYFSTALIPSQVPFPGLLEQRLIADTVNMYY